MNGKRADGGYVITITKQDIDGAMDRAGILYDENSDIYREAILNTLSRVTTQKVKDIEDFLNRWAVIYANGTVVEEK